MHKLLMAVLCCVIAASNVALAQSDSLNIITPVNEWYLKASPLALLENEGGFGVSIEYIAIKPKLGFQLEVQPILLTAYSDGNLQNEPAGTLQSGNPFGIKLRPELRYYFEGIKSKKYTRRIIYQPNGMPLLRKNETRAYAVVDFLYKYTQVERLGTFTINNGGTTTGYNQKAIYKDVKQVIGFDIKMGSVASISKLNRWFIEFYGGMGYRSTKYSFKNLPAGVSGPARSGPIRIFGRRRLINNTDERLDEFSLPLGIKILYRL